MKSGVGWAGTTTSPCRSWHCGSWCWNASEWEKKTPAITVPQVRDLFSQLLQHPAPTTERIADTLTNVLRRNEEARIYHWYTTTETFPPRRTLVLTINSS